MYSWREILLIPIEFMECRNVVLEAVSKSCQLYIDHSSGSFPSWKHDKEMLKKACHVTGAIIYHGDESIRYDEDVIEVAMKSRGFTLNSLPNKFIENKEFILRVLEINPESIFFITNELEYDEDIISAAAKAQIISIAESEYSNRSLAKIIVKANGDNLKLFPKFQDDWEIVELALAQNGLSLRYCFQKVPLKIVKIAIKQNGLALEYSRDEIKDNSEIVLLAVKQNGLALQFASTRLRSDKVIVKQALSQNPLAIEHVINLCWEIKMFQEQYLYQMNEDLVLNTVKESEYIKHLPNSIFTDLQFLEKALVVNKDLYHFLPIDLRSNKELILKILSIRDSMIDIDQIMLENEEFLLECFKCSSAFCHSHKLSSSQLSDREFIKRALAANSRLIRLNEDVNRLYKNDESMLLYALKQNSSIALNFINFHSRKDIALELIRDSGFFCEVSDPPFPYEVALKERLAFGYDNLYLTRYNIENN